MIDIRRHFSQFGLLLSLGACAPSPVHNSAIPAGQRLVTYDELMKNKQNFDGKMVFLQSYLIQEPGRSRQKFSTFLVTPGQNPSIAGQCQHPELGTIIVDVKGVKRIRKHVRKPDHDQVFAREMIVKGIFSAKPTERWSVMMTTFDASLKDAEIIASSPTSNWCVFP